MDGWPQNFPASSNAFPRSRWLYAFEAILREHYPQASSDELTLTARLAAPFPLAKPGVPLSQEAELRERAIAQIRDALAALSYAADGWYEDEAQVALDALDWLEANCPASLTRPGVP